MASLTTLFQSVNQDSGGLTLDISCREVVLCDIMDTLVKKNAARNGYDLNVELQEMLLWLDDQNYDVVLISSDPKTSESALIKAGADPDLIALGIEDKGLFYSQLDADNTCAAVVIDDDVILSMLNSAGIIINPQAAQFSMYLQNKEYLALAANSVNHHFNG